MRGGNITIHSPTLVRPAVVREGKFDESVPFLSLLEVIMARGWRLEDAASELQVLVTPMPSVFSKAKMTQRVKEYFWCLLNLHDLWSKGLRSFRHSLPKAYYALLLRSDRPGDVDPTQPAKVMQERASEMEAPTLAPRAGEESDGSVVGSAYDPQEIRSEPPSEGEDDVDSAIGSSAARQGSGQESNEEIAASEVASSSSGSSAGKVSSDVGSDDGRVEDLPKLTLPWTYKGVSFSRAVAFDKPSVVVVCPYCKCRKSHGMAQQRLLQSEWEPVAWLIAWMKQCEQDGLTGAQHRLVKRLPDAKVMEAYESLAGFLRDES
jgi:hypothetical protein